MKLSQTYFWMRIVAWYEGLLPRIQSTARGLWTNRRQGLRYAFFGVGVILFLVVSLSTSIYYGAFGKLPTYGELRAIQNNTASEVYSKDGVLLGRYYVENRVNADFEEIPIDLVNALVATEDARFFEHSGIDARAMARVALKTVLLSDRSAGGGSTISQQLAKNLFPRRDHGALTIPVNKLREIFVARRLENIYTKEELLRLYLNTVPFGENIFGIKVAAQRFFNKPAGELRTEEAAVLVGMLKANTYYNPLNHPGRARQRRNVVLRQMERYGYLDSLLTDSLQLLPLEVQQSEVRSDEGPATYFRAHLRQELEDILRKHPKPDGTPYNLYTDGLRIYTSIDSRLQRYAEDAVRTQMKAIQQRFNADWARSKRDPWGTSDGLMRAVRQSRRYQSLQAKGMDEASIMEVFRQPVPMNVFTWEEPEESQEWTPLDSVRHYLTLLNAGLLAVDPQSGQVKAWVGGIDHHYIQYDHVKARRPIGSTFKPLVYAQALEQGIDPCRYTAALQRTYPEYENWSPRNSDGNYDGYYSMEGALSNSVNTVTVELLLETGVDSVRAFAQKAGLKGELPKGPAIGLGAVDGSLLELCHIYSIFANGGKQPELHYLDRIETADGETLIAFSEPDPARFEQVISPETNAAIVHMLEAVVDSGTARRLDYEFGLRNALGGKTGTTQNQSDGWFVGITPNLVVGTWVGAELPTIHFRTLRAGQGSSTALPIAGQFLRQTYRDRTFRNWRQAEFAPLPDSLAFYLECPPYLEELPITQDLYELYLENPGLFQDLYRELRRNEVYHGADIDLKRQRNGETEKEYFERMQRYNQRLQRREERREELKDFWSEKLFGNKKKRDGGES